MKIDNTDRKIISLLQDDARQSNAVIARLIGVSEATVRRRMKLMIAGGFLEFRVVPNPAKFGLGIAAIIGFEVDPSKLNTAAMTIAGRDEVTFVGIATGRYDIIAWIRVKTLDEIQTVITNVLAKTTGVRKTETMLILDEKNRGFTWSARL